MKKILLAFLLAYNATFAQEQITPNLINNNNWTGVQYGTTPPGGYSGGYIPHFNTETNSIQFGYTWSTVAQSIAINQALSGSGIQLNGYDWGWTLTNGTGGTNPGPLYGNILTKDANGNVIHSTVNNYTGLRLNAQRFTGSVTYLSPYSLSQADSLSVEFVGKDGNFWAGYYGPIIQDVDVKIKYTADVCASNPLSSPDCPGYAAAYQTQQCSINPLFSPSCPGYTTAQCNINPLFSQSCSGYQAAYFAQQCNLDGLYSSSCPNYAEAYAKKNILGIDTTGTTTAKTQNTQSKTEASTTISTDGKVKTEVSKTGDSVVDSAIENKTTVTQDSTAPVQLTQPSGGNQNSNTQTNSSTLQNDTRKTETKTASSTSEKQQSSRTESRTSKNESKSASNENKSSGEMRQAAQQKAEQEMKKAESAATFEAQVAVQTNVIGAMSFVPGFSSYAQANVPDLLQRELQKQYGRGVVDNRNVGRRLFGASDRLHEEMVDGQYR